jgi:hypothetical protein
MATQASDVYSSLRISAEDLKGCLEPGQPVTVLDARSPKAWDASGVKIRGAIRVQPDRFRPAPTWLKDQLTVAYCT